MIGIYKIENTINHKCYVGQSLDIQRRFNDHKRLYNNPKDKGYQYPLYRAMRKYGVKNFIFTVIEECSEEDLNQREIYYIEKFHAFTKGYNQTLGGDHALQTPSDKILKAFDLLLHTKLTHKEIAKQCCVSHSLIQHMNAGRVHYNHSLQYPLQQGANTPVKKTKRAVQKRKTKIKTMNYCKKCGKEIKKESTLCCDCYKEEHQSKIKPSKELLQEQLSTMCNFEAVARVYNVTGNAVRKWCQSYNLPISTQAYKPQKPIPNKQEKRVDKPVHMIDIDTQKIIKTFQSVSEAGRFVGRPGSTNKIANVCEGQRNTAYGYIWEFVNVTS